MKNKQLIAVLLLLTAFFANAQTIDLTAISHPSAGYCSGVKFDAPYVISGSFNANNVFTAQLSDENGSFASPQVIGTLDTSVAAKIKCEVPAFLIENGGYLVRIVSSSPAVTSNNTKGVDADGCAIPTGISADVTTTTIKVGWNPTWCAEEYYVKWREKGASDWIIVKHITASTSDNNSYTITDLTPATKYQFKVKNICQKSPRESSAYTATGKATTASLKDFVAVQEEKIALYPNPVSGSAYIEFNLDEADEITIELKDVSGRSIKTIAAENFEAGNHTLNFSAEDLANGIYFVQLQTSSGSTTQKLVVQ